MTRRLLSKTIEFEKVVTLAQPVTATIDTKEQLFPLWNENLETINKSDLLLIGGGGSFNFLRHEFPKYLDKITVPYVAYAVGWNKLGFGLIRNNDLTMIDIENILKIQSKAKFFSVRKDSTKENVEAFNILVSNESPDPACWTDKLYPSVGNSPFNNYVVLAIGGDFPLGRFHINKLNEQRVGLEISRIASHFVKTKNIVVIQHRPMDAFIIKYLKMLPKNKVFIVPWESLVRKDCRKGFAIYKNADFVVASRGHALYLAFAYNVPFLAISDYEKIDGFCKKAQLLNHYVFVTEKDFGYKALEAIKKIDRKVFKEHVTKVKEEWWRKVERELRVIAE